MTQPDEPASEAQDEPPAEPLTLSRRDALKAGAAVVASSVLIDASNPYAAAPQAVPLLVAPAQAVTVKTTINGRPMAAEVDARTSLLDLLREHFALTGTKKGCDHGQCGACTVHLNGRRVLSCLTLAAQVDGRQVTTIEGLAGADGALHPMQQAFIDHDALQCGYCTPGQIMSAIACVREGHATSPEEIREYMSGNLCRCGAYVGIVAAIRAAAPRMERG